VKYFIRVTFLPERMNYARENAVRFNNFSMLMREMDEIEDVFCVCTAGGPDVADFVMIVDSTDLSE
jgi:hypothetical protein